MSEEANNTSFFSLVGVYQKYRLALNLQNQY